MNSLLTIQQVSEITGLSVHTLRYYEKMDLLAPVTRNGSGRHRRYNNDDLSAIEFLKRMRATGMPIQQLRHYVALYRQGDGTVDERRLLLEAHREMVKEQIKELQGHLEAINLKIENYRCVGMELSERKEYQKEQ